MTCHITNVNNSFSEIDMIKYFDTSFGYNRTHYPNVVFIYVSEDMNWGKEHLAQLGKNDLYFIGFPIQISLVISTYDINNLLRPGYINCIKSLPPAMTFIKIVSRLSF